MPSPRLPASTRAVLIVYNDYPLIKEAISSIKGKVDSIVAVDGRFSDFPGGDDLSTDGTREYLLSEGVQLIDAPLLDEVAKRNLYLVGEEGDWYVHLDGDEAWQGDVEIPDADMLVHKHFGKQKMRRIRLFKHVPGLHYEHKHYWLKDRWGDTFSLVSKPGKKYRAEYTDEIKILHLERSPERESQKKRYYRVLRKRENQYHECD